ncbi:efflux RND transporter periplasmic adaptor subunit [Methylophaga sp. OBS4]|uniref:efflux RND transporter periplasmic adaptor subunit n=1 Tax=Methylophaga sp. OBS4 TaxID=2991935 RepID=UPI00224E4773|nr:efflux RND transporter periplasmic adaptor subunit [Methylophaga sp. OBS4]MCX4186852.1 efflux RND transporter periplasmic adaptor subunit [Methylophaga sp. OBS4]
MVRYLVVVGLYLLSPLAGAFSLSDAEIRNLGIELAVPKSASQSLSDHYPAKVAVPNTSLHVVHAPQEGIIVNMLVAEGDVVEQGQLLATLNSPQLLMLQSDYLQAYSLLRQLREDMQRDKQLYEEGIIAERRYLQSKTRYQQQQTNVDSYAKTLHLSGMSDEDVNKLASGRLLDSTLNIHAPSTGVVMQQQAFAGQRVSAADPLYQLADLSILWLEIHVPLAIARQTEKNDQVLTCERNITATVTTIGRQVHEVDQGVLVRAVVSENTDMLTPGEFTQVCFVMNEQVSLYIVPRNALFRYQDTPSVFLIRNGEVTLLPVEVASEQEETLIIKAEMAQDSRIVISGTAALKAAWMDQEGN